ncbi:MAG: ABC transporter substrate-binding protein/permease [Coriobacteriales bacterium]|nr:ABC transporter substrate-binding protein/permease [Coriobacteriales bacterium]
MRKAIQGVVLALIAAIVLLALPLSALATGTPELSSWEDLAGKRVGMLTGAPFEEAVRAKNPQVGEMSYYSNMPDLFLALKSNKVDAMVTNQAIGTLYQSRNAEACLFPEPLAKSEMGTAFPKGSPHLDAWSAITERLMHDGTADKLWDKWTGADDSIKTVPEQSWPGTNGTLRVAACATLEPCSYLGESGMLGFDIEVLLIAAQELDVHLEFMPMEFSEILASLETGKADLGCGSILITPERKESVDFATTHANDLVLLVRSQAAAGDTETSFVGSLAESFDKTFIREKRWLLILQGLATTLVIAVSSGALGTLLGFLSVLLRRRGNRVASWLVAAFEGLMSHLPIVVVLMVFYYVVFGAINLNGIVVAIIVFTLAFGASAGAIMWNSVRGVDPGQAEAARALGATERETFFDIVLPQAANNFMPVLRGQLVSLVKDTAVVGYIAVIDLTRAGDLIRSRTMEAFFPLIATAIIYFALCHLMASLAAAIARRLDYENKPKTIKGVEL